MVQKHPLIGKILADDYQIQNILGRGGMGTVFVAEQLSMKRQVALKLVPTFDLSSEEAQRFEAEIEAMATLCHPNIVAIHQRGKFGDPPTLYYSMELLEGGSLKTYLQEYGTLPPNIALRLTKQIAEALAYAHEAGWIHRDIKSDNLLFTKNYRSLKIADFGIARLEKSVHITQSQSTVGTFLYASPEQMKWNDSGKNKTLEVDGRTDQYSLGIVCYEMLTNTLPFPATNLVEMVEAMYKPPVPLSSIMPDIPSSLEWLVSTMIAKDRENRFHSDDALLEAIASVEVEMATTNSTSSRIFAVNAGEMEKLHPHELTAEEKFRLSNLPTTNGPSIAQLQNNLKRTRKLNVIIIISAILFIFGLLSGIIVFLKKDTTQTPVVTQPVQPIALQPQPVKVQIIPKYDPEPLENQSPKFKFISKNNNMSYDNPKTLSAGSYQLVVILDGYYLKDDDTITIPDTTIYTETGSKPSDTPFQLLIHLVAIDRNISPEILNIRTNTPVLPKEYKINGKDINLKGNTTIKPGRYSLFATFDNYQNIEAQVTISPSKETFQYEALLQPWDILTLEIQLPAFKFSKEPKLDVYFDEILVNPEYINTNIDQNAKILNANVKYSPIQEYKNITLCWGFYSTFYKFDPWKKRHSLESINGERFLQFLQQLPPEKLRPCLEDLWTEYKEQIAGVDSKIQNPIYEFLKAKTIPEDYKNMESVFWKIRRLYNPIEAKDKKVFQQTEEACKNLPFADRKVHWKNLKKESPNTIYSHEIDNIIDYIDKLDKYEKQYFQAIKNNINNITPSYRRILTRIQNELTLHPYYNQQDLQYIDSKIEAELKKAGSTLKSFWNK